MGKAKLVETIHILHREWQGIRCPVCGHTLLLPGVESADACKHLRLAYVDLVGEPFFDSRSRCKRKVTYLIDDAPGPHGGRLTLVIDLGDIAGDPTELYWRHNRDQSKFKSLARAQRARYSRQLAATSRRESEVTRLLNLVWRHSSGDGRYEEIALGSEGQVLRPESVPARWVPKVLAAARELLVHAHPAQTRFDSRELESFVRRLEARAR